MDNNSSKLIGLADKNLTFNENWLEKRIVKARKKTLISGKLTYWLKYCEN